MPRHIIRIFHPCCDFFVRLYTHTILRFSIKYTFFNHAFIHWQPLYSFLCVYSLVNNNTVFYALDKIIQLSMSMLLLLTFLSHLFNYCVVKFFKFCSCIWTLLYLDDKGFKTKNLSHCTSKNLELFSWETNIPFSWFVRLKTTAF